MEQSKEYYAFISYKREDEKWAKWIQDKLEHYRFPTNLNGRTGLPKHIRPTFRDVTDLNPGLLAEEINNALCNSEWLIVVCSPRSAKSPWVCKEAQTFIDLGRADHIIPFVIEGNPFSEDIASECYPEALLHLTGSQELLAANINEMGRDAAVIKVVARMFGLRFDTLWHRYEREKKRKRALTITAVALFVMAVLGVAAIIFKQNNSLKESISRAAAGKALLLIDNGDSYLARKVATAALSQSYSVEAERVLRESSYSTNAVLKGHTESVVYADFSPDGNLIVSSSLDKTVRIWDVRTGRNTKTINGVLANTVHFSPDGNKIITSSNDGTISIWDTETGDIIFTLFDTIPNNTLNVFNPDGSPCIAIPEAIFSPDGTLIASISTNDTIRIWNVSTREKVMSINVGSLTPPEIVLFSPDNKRIVSGYDTLKMWDVHDGKLIAAMPGHYNTVFDASFNSDGSLMVSSSMDSRICIWNGFTGELIRFIDHAYAKQVKFSPNDTTIISAEMDTIRIWDTITAHTYFKRYDMSLKPYVKYNTTQKRRVLRNIIIPRISAININTAGTRIVVSSEDHTARIVDISPEHGYKDIMDIVLQPGVKIKCGPTGEILTTSRRNIIILDKRSFKTKLIISGHTGNVIDADFSPKGETVVSCSDDSTIRVWNTLTGENIFTSPKQNGIVTCVAISPNGNHIISADEKGIIKIWSKTLKEEFMLANLECRIGDISFSNDGKYLASADDSQEINIWDIQERNLVHKRLIESGGFIIIDPAFGISWKGMSWLNQYSISYSPDDNSILYTAADNTIRLFDSKTMEQKRVIDTKAHKAFFSHDGKKIVSSSGGNRGIFVWDAYDGRLLCKIGNEKYSYADFSLDDRYIISVSTKDDGVIRIWEFPPLQELIDETRERFKDNPLTPEERRQYYLE